MGISYAPFEDVTAPRPPVYDPLRTERLRKVTRPEVDSTECNYLVMFFVIGVFAIALADAMKSPN